MPRTDSIAPERLVLVHGFTQTARSWDDVVQLCAENGIETEAIDQPGHGSAGEVRGDLWDCADRLVRVCGVATYVGYSMGGRIALHAALAHPDNVRRLVLIGATAGIEDPVERTERCAADERLADHIENVGTATFVDEWLSTPLFAHLTDDQARRSDRLRNDASGLASSLRLAGTGTQTPLWDRLDEIAIPTLLLVGEHDAKFRSIAERMATLLPNATVNVIAESGHSVHLEQPEATVTTIASWLR